MDTPRVVVVTRPTEYEALLVRHGTHDQAAFFLRTRGQDIARVHEAHAGLNSALTVVSTAIPVKWRRTQVRRADLSRFVFEPGDIVIAVGQDGLVANVAKYVEGQPVIGLNPDPSRNGGILVPHPVPAAADLLAMVVSGRAKIEERTMVCATADDGQTLLALNEIFVGHESHQSARYELRFGKQSERQSSSGLIVATGTGATGWARSICRDRGGDVRLPKPTDDALAFLVREAFPGMGVGVSLTGGMLGEKETLEVKSELDSGGVVFGDGIEDDRISLTWGQRVNIGVANTKLHLVAAR